MYLKTTWLAGALFILPILTGCSQWGPRAWVEETRELEIPAESIERLDVTTHNGPIEVLGHDERDSIHVVATCKGYGESVESAEACLAALVLVSDGIGATHQLGWKYDGFKQADWSANVAFEIAAPRHLAADLESHNGRIEVRHLNGPCDLLTHNGPIRADVGAEPLTVVTHNGGIVATCSGNKIDLRTHNGSIQLDASKCGELAGKATSHNGAVQISVGEETSSELSCTTHNGRITCDVPWMVKELSRREAKGTIGEGGSSFHAETYNGSIRIVKAAP